MSTSPVITTQPTNPLTSLASKSTDESIKPSTCCYRGYHWSHLVTIPGALIAGGGAAYSAYLASYYLAGAFCFGSVSSSIGAIAASWLVPQNNLERNVNKLPELNSSLKEQNADLEKRLIELQTATEAVKSNVNAAGVIIEKTSAELASQDSEVVKELQKAQQKEVELKKLLVKYQTAFEDLSSKVSGLSNLSSALETQSKQIEEAGANLSTHIQSISVTSGAISQEKDELQVAVNQFDKLNDTFCQRVDILSTMLSTMQETNSAMADRIDELEKIQKNIDETKVLIETLVAKIETLNDQIHTKFEHMDEAWETAELVKSLAVDVSTISSKVL